jgi:hypothetical protein
MGMGAEHQLGEQFASSMKQNGTGSPVREAVAQEFLRVIVRLLGR